MFKMTGSFDIITDMFIANCVPILTDNNTKNPSLNDPTKFTITCKFTLQISDLDVNCVDILGYEKDELINKKTLYDLISVKYLDTIKSNHKLSSSFYFMNF